jgi:hypothetical protein
VDVMNDLLKATLALFAAAVVLFIVEMLRP